MTRREKREQAFVLLFERIINRDSMKEIIENAELSREYNVCEYAKEIAVAVEEHEEELNEKITEYLKGWKIHRLSTTSLALLQYATYELLYCEDIPGKVAINEAVHLAKIYGTDKDGKYINGVLGAMMKDLNRDE